MKKKYRVFWAYQSHNGYEEGIVGIVAMSSEEAENIFYERNVPHAGPDGKIGFMVNSIEEEEGEN